MFSFAIAIVDAHSLSNIIYIMIQRKQYWVKKVCVRVRESERERDGETDRQRERE